MIHISFCFSMILKRFIHSGIRYVKNMLSKLLHKPNCKILRKHSLWICFTNIAYGKLRFHLHWLKLKARVNVTLFKVQYSPATNLFSSQFTRTDNLRWRSGVRANFFYWSFVSRTCSRWMREFDRKPLYEKTVIQYRFPLEIYIPLIKTKLSSCRRKEATS